MISLIDLSNWKTKKEVLKELQELGVNVSERSWRLYVESYNKRYADNEVDKMIAHGNKGYKLTNETEDINQTIKDYESRAWNMYKKALEISKASGRNMNYRMEELS